MLFTDSISNPVHSRWAMLVVLSLGITVLIPEARAEWEFIAFPELTAVHRSSLLANDGLKQNDIEPAIDLFATGSFSRLRLLGELVISSEEMHLERAQVGWLMSPQITLWLGRFHSPLGYWRTQYHHGAFMQNAISHPGIVAFEDHGGILPSHTSGLLLEGTKTGEHAGLHYAVAVGAGPELGEEGMESLNIVRPGRGTHKLSISARLTYLPDAFGPDEAGLFAGHTRIPSTRVGIEEVRQTIAGGFANWQGEKLRLFGAVFVVRTQLESSTSTSTDNFVSGYLQGEYAWQPGWIGYARQETSGGVSDNAFLELFPHFIRERSLAGARWDFTSRQSLKLEVARSEHEHSRFNEMTLQWSAVFP